MLLRKTTGEIVVMGGLRTRGDRAMRALDFAMMNVPTLWTAFVINFLALALIWAYILHSYPTLEAARYWTGSACAVVASAVTAMVTVATGSLVPLLFAGTGAVFAVCLAVMGVRRF